MKRIILMLTLGMFSCFSFAQTGGIIKGTIRDEATEQTLQNARLILEGTTFVKQTNMHGVFVFENIPEGSYTLKIDAIGYITKRMPIIVENDQTNNLGVVLLSVDVTQEQADNLITLTDTDLSDDEGSADVTSGILQATRDTYLSKAAFDFGQAFFRVRGYDSQFGKVLFNGVEMNKIFNGRAQWSDWGGLNDVTRNQELANGLSASNYSFGGVLGTTNISTRASGYRPGFRLSSSTSNRTYTGRFMATYSSGMQDNSIAYTISASRRWGNEGYIDGTLYDAYSFFAAVEYKINDHNSINATVMYTPNRRGSSSAVTQEVFDLVGRKYNPYWGWQDDEKRNSRIKNLKEPIFMLTHYFENEKLKWNSSVAYQFGSYGRSRLQYFNAYSPDPIYYKNLPSYYSNLNEPEIALLAKQQFLENPQIAWDDVYQVNLGKVANGDGSSVYVQYEDRTDDKQFTANTNFNYTINENLELDIGLTYKYLNSSNFANILDLLGGNHFDDIDGFSGKRNDINGTLSKNVGDHFDYDYNLHANVFNEFLQLQFSYNKIDFFLSSTFTYTDYQREGNYLNGLFPENSLGKSTKLQFGNAGVKGGFTYKINGRHLINVNGAYITQAPTLQNSFVNSRESNQVVNNLTSEKVSSVDASYLLRLTNIKARLTGYYTTFKDATGINFFFLEGGVGTDFVQEVVTGLNSEHFGLEFGIEAKLTPTLTATGAAGMGQYTYTNNANTVINFDTAGAEEQLINTEGTLDLGTAYIKNYKVASGPQKAYSVGLTYRDPHYWWIGATGNYLSNNYTDISTVTRTSSFYLNPDDLSGGNFPGVTEDVVKPMLKQQRLDDFYLVNLVGGKSWRYKGTYISIFVSINNLLDATFRTGGYEQGRTGNFGELSADLANGTPSFGPKYWYGFGRTYFINLAVSF
ncbi:beta-sandwich domain-containing protein [Zhouia sp. PK063]|uniref:beta-sandwich domain-containing protein n=1 Tax=Zhouia sp. PK063 TaxID=3373602 RepID=UPI003794EC58